MAGVIACIFAVPILKFALNVNDPVLPPVPAQSVKDAQGISVPLSQVSSSMKFAILAAEDHRFYEHQGVDLIGLTRAMTANLKAHHMVAGGSTITQQLAKVMFLDQNDRTAQRKLRQVILSVELEDKYPKDQILEAYLNTIYFGRGAYGIEDAARKYFGVHASQLTPGESAFLAGVVKAPSILGDPSHLPEAITRQHQVIENMREYGYITPRQAAVAEEIAPQFKSMHHIQSGSKDVKVGSDGTVINLHGKSTRLDGYDVAH